MVRPDRRSPPPGGRALAAAALAALAGPAAAQEPWYEPGQHAWGRSFLAGSFAGVTGTLPLELALHYPAAVEGVDVPMAPSGAPWPVVFFQHAGGSDYDEYDYLFSRLASRGYLVVSARHDGPGWGSGATYEENHVLLFHAAIDLVVGEDRAPGSFLFGKVDEERLALAGHSHGCLAALQTMGSYAPLDPSAELEVDAVHMLSPCPSFASGGAMETYVPLYGGMPPLQVVYGSRDTDGCVAFGQAIAIHEAGGVPRSYVYVEGADHYAFTDSGSMGQSTITREEAQRAAGTATIAWLEHVLGGDDAARAYLAGDLPLLASEPPRTTKQLRDPDRLVIDDFEPDGDPVPSVGIAGSPGVFVNGFLSDAFVDHAAGVALVREELRRVLPPGPPPVVLYYEDATLGPASVYADALAAELAAGTLGGVATLSDSGVFATNLLAGVGDVIVAAHQSSPGAQPHDAPLAQRLCEGTPALLSDWRNLPSVGASSAEPALACAGAGFDGTENFVELTSTGDLFAGTLLLTNPGWGKSTVGLALDGATAYATTEALVPPAGDPTVNALGLPVTASGLAELDERDLLLPAETLYHPTGGLLVAWDAPGARLVERLAPPGGGLDARAWDAVSLRLTQVHDAPQNPVGATKDLYVVLRDAAGREAAVPLGAAPQGPLRYPFEPAFGGWKSVLETYRLPFARFLAVEPALDLGALSELELAFDLSPAGRLALDDLALVPLPVPVAAATPRAGCVAPAAPGSLVAAGGPPVVGEPFAVAIDDPAGAAGLTPGATLTVWAVATDPAAGAPCGVVVPGWGPGAAPGELLVSLSPPSPVLLTAPVAWSGAPAVHAVAIPPAPALAGLALASQGALVDPTGAGDVVVTDALDLVLGI